MDIYQQFVLHLPNPYQLSSYLANFISYIDYIASHRKVNTYCLQWDWKECRRMATSFKV